MAVLPQVRPLCGPLSRHPTCSFRAIVEFVRPVRRALTNVVRVRTVSAMQRAVTLVRPMGCNFRVHILYQIPPSRLVAVFMSACLSAFPTGLEARYRQTLRYLRMQICYAHSDAIQSALPSLFGDLFGNRSRGCGWEPSRAHRVDYCETGVDSQGHSGKGGGGTAIGIKRKTRSGAIIERLSRGHDRVAHD